MNASFTKDRGEIPLRPSLGKQKRQAKEGYVPQNNLLERCADRALLKIFHEHYMPFCAGSIVVHVVDHFLAGEEIAAFDLLSCWCPVIHWWPYC